MRKHLLFLSVMLTMAVLPAFAQTVTGRVTSSSDNSPLPGVSVVLKGTTRGTATDADGNYSLNVAGDESGILVISFIGFSTQEISAQGRTTIDIVLQEDISQLGEVVITGFGEKKDVGKVSYAVQEVRGGDLSRANNPNLINALQGKVAGVMINQGASGPSSSSRIRIRGNSSLSNNTQPLFVIDGVLIRPTPTGANSYDPYQDNGDIMKNINPDNIESMSVLKGSAASALYGSDALNGVILITTKKGTFNKGIGVTYNHTSSFETAYKYLDIQNEFGGGVKPTFDIGSDGVRQIDASTTAGGAAARFHSFGPKFDGGMVRDVDGRMVEWKANDPLDYFETGKFVNHNVVLEGGTDKSAVRLSYSNLNNTSVVPSGNEMVRNNFNLNLSQKIGTLFDVNFTADYTHNTVKNPVRQQSNFNPTFRFVYFRPRHLDIDYWTNNYIDPVNGGAKTGTADPYNIASGFMWDNFQDKTEHTETIFRANVDLTTHLTPWLNFLVRANVQDELYKDERRRMGSASKFEGGLYNQSTSDNTQYRIQTLLTANRQLNPDFFVSATIGAETNKMTGGRFYKAFTRNAGGQNEGATLRVPGIFSLANSLNGIGIETRMLPSRLKNAFYIYGDVTYKDMLTLTLSYRNDYSSTLAYADGSGDWSYSYPAAGLAWTFTETFKNTLPSWLSFGTLRANVGITGGDTDPWTINQTGLYESKPDLITPGGTVSYGGFKDNVLANKGLKNREAREWEIGADLRFLDNRVGLDVAYYNKLSKNEIFTLPTAIESGVTTRVLNGGEISNKGIELVLRVTPVRNEDWEWNSSFNYTRNRNKVESLPAGVAMKQLEWAFGEDMYSMAKAGLPYGTIATKYGYATYQKKDAEGNAIDHPSNGQKVIGSVGATEYSYIRSSAYGQKDRELGTAMERFLLSNVNTVSFKNFTLNVQVDAKIGGNIASGSHQYGSYGGNLKNSLFGRDLEHGGVQFTDASGQVRTDGIIPEGVLADGIKSINPATPNKDLGGMTYAEAVANGDLRPIPAVWYYDNLSNWGTGIREYSVFENSWVSLREVSLSYNVPASFASKIRAQTLRFSVTGRNLTYLYTTAKGGINPEGLKSNKAGEFAEYGGMPFTRQLGFSVTAGF